MTIPEATLLRAATSADVPALTALINAAYHGDEGSWTSEGSLIRGPRIAAAEVAARLRPPHAMLVAEVEGKVRGCVHVEPRAASGYIGLLSVDPTVQSQKLGSRLMRAAEEHVLSALGTRRSMVWVVSARTELRAWYERLGYAATGETHPFPEKEALVQGLHFVVLAKELSA